MVTIQEQQDLGIIKLPPSASIYVSLLPTVANAVIVKYDPDIQVSCVIPPRDYEITYHSRNNTKLKKATKVSAPSLIMSCGYGDVPNPSNYKALTYNRYGLYAVDDTRKKQIWVKPYLLSNVWDKTGAICFGTLQPGSLRQAFNYYWNSSFNPDLLRTPHICKNKNHYYDYHSGCRCQKQKAHKCDCTTEIFHNHFGCGCSTVALSKKCRGSCGNELSSKWADVPEKNRMCACCASIFSVVETALKSNPKLTKTKKALLAKKPNLTGEPVFSYPGCGCTARHMRSCACRLGSCNCPCNCNCCLKKCSHKACTCGCCAGICSCPCRCSELQKLAFHLDSYHDTLLKEQSWIDFTATFCGVKYWASPKSAEGVLVCNNKYLLNEIPREFWRKDKLGQPLVVCLGNRLPPTGKDVYWKFESGGFTFTLLEKCVITK